MRLISSIEKIAEDIGFDIGNTDDVTQAKLLNGFCRAVHNSISSHSDLEMQLCYIVDKLTPQSFEIIKALNEFKSAGF